MKSILVMNHDGDHFLLTCHVIHSLDFDFHVCDACNTIQKSADFASLGYGAIPQIHDRAGCFGAHDSDTYAPL